MSQLFLNAVKVRKHNLKFKFENKIGKVGEHGRGYKKFLKN